MAIVFSSLMPGPYHYSPTRCSYSTFTALYTHTRCLRAHCAQAAHTPPLPGALLYTAPHTRARLHYTPYPCHQHPTHHTHHAPHFTAPHTRTPIDGCRNGRFTGDGDGLDILVVATLCRAHHAHAHQALIPHHAPLPTPPTRDDGRR